jgi:hypothetical protein
VVLIHLITDQLESAMKNTLSGELSRAFRSLFIWMIFLGTAIPAFSQGTILGGKGTEQIHASSESLLVYETADLSSDVVGRLIYDEIIVVKKDFAKAFMTGTWLKIQEPYVGFYLRIATPIGAAESDMKSQLQESHFREPADLPQPKEKPAEQEPRRDVAEEEESKGFVSSFFSLFSGDDEEEEQMKEEPAPVEEAVTEDPVEESIQEPASPVVTTTISPFWMRDKKKKTVIGLGAGLVSSQEEDDFSGSGTPLEIHFDIMGRGTLLSKIRFGVNKISAENDDFKATTQSIYAALRVRPDQLSFENIGIFVLGGIAWMQSSLSGDDISNYQGVGAVLGGGATYMFTKKVGLGGQLISFMKQAYFENQNISIGSTQIQLIASYSF